MKVDNSLTLQNLEESLNHFFEVSGKKIKALHASWDTKNGTPVFTSNGQYTTKGWTEWTQGFMYGWAILQFDATGDESFLEMGRKSTVDHMAPHVSHIGVHDHGFNNVSTYGNLRRLMLEGRLPFNEWELNFYELALKASGAVQASRWSTLSDGTGYIYSFNGPQSLFIDTIRSLRSLAVAHQLGHKLMGEGDEPISLLDRLIQHAKNTARYNIYYGEQRDSYDVNGRVAHESIFNTTNGTYRCPSSQQGYCAFSTWTRGLAWALLGYAEQLEFISTLADEELEPFGGREEITGFMLKAAKATADFYLQNTALDGIPYWDTGAPKLDELGQWRDRPADPYNDKEPVDSSAAAIAAQGLARLGRYMEEQLGDSTGRLYFQAALTTSKALFSTPYLSEDENHQGLILHSIYHQPNGWDYVPEGSVVPNGESSLWGDYHAVELALYLKRLLEGKQLNFEGKIHLVK
ncbi:glycosyl hydrolase [Bacillus sp. SA1-12]|uniref:glycoside hydrolase family 88 protein n=1 Tax=Bacillus sp. SA1-12 TaxID=1455638 RepID=UPI0006262B7F|nr:glycoside hydrolase family 88 protein [Bacillus sp. SA1-12]KKI91839.1 glycosyl hydrolase [Bacillus sp. SA1-12]